MIDALPKSNEIYFAHFLGRERPEFNPRIFCSLLALRKGRIIGEVFGWS
jgi:hypothetical protein